jgi:TP901 family phage tail tape measure protein
MSRFVLTAQLQLQAPNNVAQVVRQIQNQLNNVTVNVQVQNSQRAQRQLQQVTQQTNQAASAAERMGRAFAVSVRRFAAFSVATRAVGLFTSTLSDAVQTAIDFERQLIKVSQVTGESLGKLSRLTSTITDLSTSLGVTSKDLLDVSTTLLQAGLSSKDTEVALKSLAKAALAPNFDSISETAEGAIAILAQFGLGVKALEGQLGSINAVAGAFAVEASDLIDVIRRTGGVFKASGGDLNELLALFTSVRATTRESAESIGTGLRTIFTRIQRPKTIEYLKQFGVELVDLNGKFVGPFEAVKRLSEALSGLGEGDITFIRIAEELGGFRQIGKVLPLLQQFSTAQAALNVANKAGNSLTQDAATAQAALAIRIIKVREEFLALVRSITETSTFQVMANTALSLASALIKLSDSIKPLLPLLGALAAVRIAKGLGTFAGGLMGGFASGRTFNKGGKVHHFARGGMVPGTGNRDTVPAMLQPGEFVIKKSSVNKLGAGNLAAMNENRFQTGGPMTTAEKIAAARMQNTTANPNRQKTKVYEDGQQKPIRFSVADGNIGAFFMNPEAGTDGLKSFKKQAFDITNSKILSLAGISPKEIRPKDKQGRVLPRMPGEKSKFSAKGILEAGSIQTFFPSLNDVKSGSLSNIIQSNVKQKLSEAVVDTANFISNNKLLDIPPIDANDALLRQTAAQRIQSDTGAISTTAGYLFEGVIDAITGAKPASSNAVFDFPASSLQGNRGRLGALFGNTSGISAIKQADAKASYSSKIIDGGPGSGSISSKIINSINNGVLAGIKVNPQKKHFGGLIRKFATGGGVGTDTVPALLTPGEFVVNRSSAQRIGYGALNKMNKVGRYAKGGVVQQFATGATGSGVSSSGTGGGGGRVYYVTAQQAQALGTSCQNAAASTQQVTQANNQQKRSVGEVITSNKMFAASMTVGLLQTFLPALDENSSALTRMSHSLVGLVSTITTVGFALEAFGVAINLKSIAGFLSGTQSLTGSFKSLSSSSTKLLSAGFKRGMAGGTRQATSVLGRVGQSAGGFVNRASDIGSGINASFNLGRQGKSLTSLTGGRVPIGYRASNFLGKGFEKVAGSTLGSAVGSLGSRIGGAASAIGSRIAPYASAPVTGFKAGMAGKNIVGGNAVSQGLGAFGKSLSTVTKGLNAAAGPLLLVELGLMAASGAVNAFFDYQNQTNKAIQEGNIAKASENAVNLAAQESIDSFGSSAILAGAAIGSLVPGVGTLLGGIIGAGVALTTKFLPSIEKAIFGTDYVNRAFITLGTAFGGNTYSSIKDLASAQAQAVKTQKSFEQGQKNATDALQDLQNGTISASEALSKIANVETARQALQTANEKAVESNKGNKSGMVGGFLRGTARVATLGLAGYMGLESGKQRNERINKENAGLIKQNAESERKAFEISRPIVNETMKRGIAQGMTREQIDAQLGANSAGAMRSRMSRLRIKASQADTAGNTEEANAFREQAAILEEQAKELDKAFANLEKEAENTRKAFEAMNLGMQNIQGAASAAALSVTNYTASQQAGFSPLKQSLAVLEASVTSAAQGISDADFEAAFSNAEETLRKFGASDKQINKLRGNIKSINEVQKNSATIFKQTKDQLKGRLTAGSADDRRKAFSDIIGKNLKAQGYDDETIKRLQDQIGTLSQDQINALGEGRFDVFEQIMGDLGKKTLEQINGPLNDAIKIEEELNGLTKRRIELERSLIDAQVESLNVRMEARDIQAKYGGKAVTPAERRQNIIDIANTQGRNVAGVGGLTTGNAADIQRRSAQIAARQAELGAIRNRAAAGDQGAIKQLAGQGGLQLEEEERKLAQAAKDQLNATRELIKAKEQELQIVQEKNKLEKQSMESLISGDIEKFFEQQAAVGATAAIATGNETLMNQFGATALAGAYTDIQRQQEAGVQSIYGQQIGGPGGLAEQSAQAALRARGVQSQAAAQMMAGTTPEQEAIKGEIRALAETMGPTADLQTQAADLQLQAAQMQIQAAQARGEAAIQQTEARQMARGGAVYANRGMFIPRGTDTVPAMLTPGEFVVNRAAVQRGNNLQLLQAMNGGMNAVGYSRGGKVQYLRTGGVATGGSSLPSIDPKLITDLSNALNGFNTELARNITNLQNTKFQIKLDTTSINVNINGTSFLATLRESIQKEFMGLVAGEISKYKVGTGGKLTKSDGVLNNYT